MEDRSALVAIMFGCCVFSCAIGGAIDAGCDVKERREACQLSNTEYECNCWIRGRCMRTDYGSGTGE